MSVHHSRVYRLTGNKLRVKRTLFICIAAQEWARKMIQFYSGRKHAWRVGLPDGIRRRWKREANGRNLRYLHTHDAWLVFLTWLSHPSYPYPIHRYPLVPCHTDAIFCARIRTLFSLFGRFTFAQPREERMHVQDARDQHVQK